MRALLVLVFLAAGCSAKDGHPAFRAASDAEAQEVVRAFLDAAVAGDAEHVASHVCDTGPEAKERAMAAVKGPLLIKGYEVTRVEPAWVGAEPYYRVDVALKKAAGTDRRSLSVRAREGCVDRLLGEPVESARKESGEISL